MRQTDLVAPRPPSDAIVALRSLDRRYREAFAAVDEASVDELAHRDGADGRSALDHVVAASHTLTFLGRALEMILVEDDPVLHPAVLDAAARVWPDSTGTLRDRLAELAWEADAVADRAAGVAANDWARRARVAGDDQTVSAADIVWDAVDSAVGHLRATEAAITRGT